MPKPHNSSLTDLSDALTIDAFDQFRSAAHGADLPLAIINAFAAYKTAVDFALLATAEQGNSDQRRAKELVDWALGALKDMRAELGKLDYHDAPDVDYPAH